MVESDARDLGLGRDEGVASVASRSGKSISIEDFKTLIEQEGLWVNDVAAQSALGALCGGELDLDELDAVAGGTEGVEVPVALPRFDDPTEAGPFR